MMEQHSCISYASTNIYLYLYKYTTIIYSKWNDETSHNSEFI